MKASADSKKIDFIRILKGVVRAYLFTLFLFLILALLIYFTSVSESIIPKAVIIISAFSIFLSGIDVTRNIDSMGWLHGGLIGFLYIAILLMLSFLIVPSFYFKWNIAIDLFLGFLTGVLAGILGVNI
ncbi:TIGR04086 family membrane protein [Tepidanaerobacter acetatoxydans]|uniref:TIGR04086 family membrane protein n=1 Tax=Tepidanaerobacter acetatoxydans TaxID=499229 RepID=UPI001BD3D664|nr:TIGR04086 family membrane protein [Tepidanaerobacter acetatoxydans]